MCPSIDIDAEVFDVLKNHAEIFVDSPNTVLRRLLGLAANGHVELESMPSQNGNGSAETARPERSASARAEKRGKTTRTRVAHGTLLPESEYETPILRYLEAHGGRAPSREVVEAIGIELDARLTEADKAPLNSGEIRWKSRAAFVRLRLVERGDLDGQAPRGTWEITDQGRERARGAE